MAMFARNRISRVFASAQEVTFDDSSRIVIMSDCHRGDGSLADEFSNNKDLYYAALNEYYSKNFTYIELGDGDELWENKRITDIVPLYETIFDLLSRFHESKRLFLLFGNHDLGKRNPGFFDRIYSHLKPGEKKKAPLFPHIKIHEGLILNYRNSEKKIFLLHGHQADFLNGPLWRLSRFLVRHLWKPLELIGVSNPTSAAKNYRKKTKVEKELLRWAQENRLMLIAGHTHRPVFPEPGTPLYFNDGCCVYQYSITALEIENSAITLVRWINLTKGDGTVKVLREVLAGPRKLDEYFEDSGSRSAAAAAC